MKLYVYNKKSLKVLATIDGCDNKECEILFKENFGSDDRYRATYFPAFGFEFGLKGFIKKAVIIGVLHFTINVQTQPIIFFGTDGSCQG